MRFSSPAERRVSVTVLLRMSTFCTEPFLMSPDWMTPFLIWSLEVMIVAAYAVPAQATASAVTEMTSAGLGRRSFIGFSPTLMSLP
jgi:hypothetical protein